MFLGYLNTEIINTFLKSVSIKTTNLLIYIPRSLVQTYIIYLLYFYLVYFGEVYSVNS